MEVDKLAIVFLHVFTLMALIGAIYGMHVEDRWQHVSGLLYVAGSLGVGIFVLGITAAAISSQFPNVFVVPWIVSDYQGKKADMKSTPVRAIVIGMAILGITVPLFKAQPIWVMVASQALNAILLPATVICMIWLSNSRKLMGDLRNNRMQNLVFGVILLFALFMSGAGINGLFGGTTTAAAGNDLKRIVYVNSYHRGFPPSDEITAGVMEKLPSDSFRVFTHFMDTKRNPSEEYIRQRAKELFDSIQMEDPDVLIVSDDNALKHLAIPYFRDSKLPIVFCGINWSAAQYDLSQLNITGILEILPVKQSMETMKMYDPSIKNVLVLNENTTTSRKTKPILDTLLGGIGLEVSQELVDDFERWKEVFTDANRNYDIIYLQTRGAIRDWDHEEALEHINRHIQVPTVTCEDFMMPYSVYGLTQLSREQGMVAAEKARLILSGSKPADMPLTRNKMTRSWLNPGLAEKTGIDPEDKIFRNATVVDGNDPG